MKFAVIQFPGSNCDTDCVHAINALEGASAALVWHKEQAVDAFDAIVLPGGFSYGDYLRCGAIARFSPVMQAVRRAAEEGKLVLGICNGFQILCESGLLPGALVRNRSLHFICEFRELRVESYGSAFTNQYRTGAVIRLPIAHGEGCYVADRSTLQELNIRGQVLLRYSDGEGRTTQGANPNGSVDHIAGVCNRPGNVFGLMPHPERAGNALLGGSDGNGIFLSMMETFKRRKVA